MKEKITNEQIKTLFSLYFRHEGKPFKAYDYQTPIIRSILFSKDKKICINATTRAGKSLIIGLCAIIWALDRPNSKIVIIGPTYNHTRIIMDYIAEHITDSPWISEMVDLDRKVSVERLRKEVSKNRITFKNKSVIFLLSAEGKARGIIGRGADLIIEDEAELISDETHRTKIMRMLGESPNSKIVLIGNAVGLNHFYEASISKDYKKIHINWRDCVREGRLTKEFVEDRKKQLTPAEFEMWLESNFVEDLESKLISKEWIDKAIYKPTDKVTENTIFGLDIAELGNDLSVLTGINAENDIYKVVFLKSWEKKETMQTVGIVTKYISNKNQINVDATGVGNGVWSRLKEMGYQANKLLTGSSPTRERDRFLNLKAQLYWRLRTLFEEGRIKIPNHPTLIEQLNKLKYEITSAGKIKIIDPEDKSPDFADSLCYAVSYHKPKLVFSKVRMT